MNSPHLFTPTAQAHYSKLPKPPTATSAVNTHVPNFSSTANNNFNKNSSIGTNSNNLSNNFINNNNISNNSNSLIASLSSATAQATTATASPLMPAAAENLTTLSNSPATNTVPSFSSPQTSISNKIAPARRLAARQTLRLTIPKQHGDTFILPSTNSNTAPISSSNHNNHHIIFKHTSPSQLPPAPILKRTATGSVLTSQHQQNIPKSASPLESHNLPNVTPSAFTHSHTPSTLSCSSSSAVSNNGSSKYLGSLRKPSITLNSSDIRNNNDLLAFAKSLTPPSVDLNDHHSPIFSEISSSMSPSSSTASPTNHLSRLFNLSPPTFRNYGNMSDFSDSSQNGVITPATSLIENFHKKNGSPSTNTSLVGSTSPSLNGTNAIANNGVNCLSNCNSLTGRQINTSSSSCSSVKETSSTSQQVVNSSSTTTRVEKTSQRLHHITSSSSSTSSSSQATSSSEMKTAALKRDLNEIKSSMSEINDLALGRNTTNASNSSETVINELKKKIKSSFENLVDGDDNQYVTFPDDDDHDHNLGSCLDLVDTSKSVQIPENGKIIDAVKFEEKRTKTESKTKVVADGFSSEQATSNSAEVKRLQAGDIDYKEAKAAAAMRNRMEVGGVKTEENAALIQEAISLKTGDITQQASNNVAAASKKYQSDNFSADQKSISQSQQSQTVTSNGIISQEKHVSSASQSNYTMTHKGVSSTGSSMISSSSQMSTTNSQLIKLADLKLDDLKALCAGSGTKEIEQTIVKYSKVLESVVESLQESKAPNPEKSLYLDKINEVIEKAWSVPTHGHQLGYSLCSSLRKSGGLDLLMRNCVQGDMQIKFSSAKLLEQCLTTENREHVVHNGLDKVVNVACVCTRNTNTEQSRVGTGILEHLFKHSEGTCSDVIKLGGLDAVLFECRTSDVETLRHCASALANLSLYGGAENQEAMINRKVPMWLFPLAFHDDDNIKYYACLAIAVLVANKEIEAEVLKSGCLDLVEPFVTTHDPSEFAKSNLAHAHGQSEAWLRRLVPVLSSNREEARNLAAFHFCMEAGIKKQQNETKIFQQIGAIEALKTVASCPNAIASKFAAQALRLIDEEVPHKLSQQVPLWSVEDVKEWVKQIGFSQYSKTFEESKVDGDLLLKLTDENLRNDIGLTNGILLKRFERELQILKRMADYSSKDSAKIHQFLAEIGPDYCTYTYSMLNAGIDKLSLPQLNEDMLLGECGIKNSIHRLRILNAVKNLENSLPSSSEENMAKTLDVFVSYRRSNGSQLASLLKVHLQLRGFSVFIDVERLEAGKFDNGLLNSIRQAKNFVLVLTPRALERCVGDEEGKDWVHREIVAALDSNCNIIPIIDQQFAWPEFEKLPEDMRSVCHFNGVTWSHDYQDACIEKIERFMRGDRVDRPIGPTTTYQRMQSNDSDYTTNNGNVVGSSSVGVTPNGGGQASHQANRFRQSSSPARQRIGGGGSGSVLGSSQLSVFGRGSKRNVLQPYITQQSAQKAMPICSSLTNVSPSLFRLPRRSSAVGICNNNQGAPNYRSQSVDGLLEGSSDSEKRIAEAAATIAAESTALTNASSSQTLLASDIYRSSLSSFQDLQEPEIVSKRDKRPPINPQHRKSRSLDHILDEQTLAAITSLAEPTDGTQSMQNLFIVTPELNRDTRTQTNLPQRITSRESKSSTPERISMKHGNNVTRQSPEGISSAEDETEDTTSIKSNVTVNSIPKSQTRAVAHVHRGNPNNQNKHFQQQATSDSSLGSPNSNNSNKTLINRTMKKFRSLIKKP